MTTESAGAAPAPALAELCGPLLMGYMLNWALFGTLSIQLCKSAQNLYYRAFPEDRILIKLLVYAVYLVEIAQTALLTHDAFTIFATGFGDVSGLARVNFDWYTIPVTTGIVSSIGHAFYAYRIYLLSRSYWIPVLIIVVSLTSNISGMVDAGFSRAVGVLPSPHTKEISVLTIWLAGAALTDVLIALAFTYYASYPELYRFDTGFRRTHTLIVKLIRLTIETGALTAVIALIDLVLFLAFPGKPYLFTLGAILPKLYANTMLAVLNSRFVILDGRGHTPDPTHQSFSYRVRQRGLGGTETVSGSATEYRVGEVVFKRPAGVVTISREVFEDREMGELVEMKDVGVPLHVTVTRHRSSPQLPAGSCEAMTSLGPILPRELEKEIFQLAAYCDPLFVPTLELVAWRVKSWVETPQYRIILLSNSLMYPHKERGRLASVPLSLLCDSVRHLFLGYTSLSDSLGASILSTSTGVEDLWLSGPVTSLVLATVAPELKPRRLHCNLTELFAEQPQVNFTHGIFSCLTHVGIFIYGDVVSSWAALAALPCLTHLSFDDESFFLLLPDIVEQCKSLRCIVYVLADSYALDDNDPDLEFAKDLRFVKMVCEKYVLDWQAGALRSEDYWARADEFIRMRRSGEVDATEYIIRTDESKQLRVE
ncbi:hypothetical protein FB45DRAFT_1060589 [Roridomyces roridus]|uniref:DUF6534 domain-containing protein n=1 Tax=Roridomyces roridus TaxID=1738132 RepID=A0AAD7BNR4_9AGAR|nr:hypothetical protein FB45DRAFT_1060589 [Roridomyces roridus]